MRHLLLFLSLAALSFAQTATQSPPSQSQQRLIPDGTHISVELNTTLNSKKAKVGDPVKLQVTEDTRSADGTVLIPAGAKLFGKVSLAVPYSKGSGESRLSIVVERAEWKKGSATLNGFIAGRIVPPPYSLRNLVDQYVWVEVPPGTTYPGPTSIPPRGTVSTAESRGQRPHPAESQLRMADDPKIGSELVSKKKDVELESGTTFVIRHIIVRDK